MTDPQPAADPAPATAAPAPSTPAAPPGRARKVFRPNLWLTLLAIPGLALLIYLGNWQSGRYQESTARIERYHRQHDALPPVRSLAEAGPEADHAKRLHFRRAELTGTLDPSQVQLLTARYVLGQRGYAVVAPLQVAGGAHPRLLVHLGWVPDARVAEFLKDLQGQPQRTVQGRLQIASDRHPDEVPVAELHGRPVWLHANPTALSKRVPGLEPDLMLQVGEQASGKTVDINKIPVTGYVHPVRMAPSKHIEYAATWYGLAATLVAVWIALGIKEREA